MCRSCVKLAEQYKQYHRHCVLDLSLVFTVYWLPAWLPAQKRQSCSVPLMSPGTACYLQLILTSMADKEYTCPDAAVVLQDPFTPQTLQR